MFTPLPAASPFEHQFPLCWLTKRNRYRFFAHDLIFRFCLFGALSTVFTLGDFATGQTFITGTTTASGPGTYSATGNNALIISDPNSDIGDPAFLTLTGGITTATNGVQGVVVGLLNGEKGSLLVQGGSWLNNSGSGNKGNFGGFFQVVGGVGHIGLNAGSTGTATVTGIGSQWTNSGTLFVGFAGTGTLNIQSGGSVSNSHGSVGDNSGSQGTVNITGTDSNGVASKWTNSDNLTVGRFGTGTLNIQNGGSVSNATGIVGYLNGSQGTVTVTGMDFNGVASKWTNSDNLTVGQIGSGTLNILDGGKVSNTTTGAVGIHNGSHGTVNVSGNGSTWTNGGDLILSGTGTSPSNATAGAGNLTVDNGGKVVVGGSLIVHTNGKLAGDGGTIEGNVTSYGTVAPGNSTGILTIDGNYTQEVNGKLEIQLGGTTAGTGYDQLLVMGNVTLNSSAVLDVSMWNAFELGLNQSFDILAIGGGTLTGTFLNLNDGDLVDQFNGVDLYIDYHIGGVTLFTGVPEPTSLMLIGIAILFGASPRNRRRK